MITAEFLASFGSFRKWNSELKNDFALRLGMYDKDEINKIVDFWVSRGYDRETIRAEYVAKSREIERQAAERALSVIGLTATSLNRLGYTEERVKLEFRS